MPVTCGKNQTNKQKTLDDAFYGGRGFGGFGPPFKKVGQSNIQSTSIFLDIAVSHLVLETVW